MTSSLQPAGDYNSAGDLEPCETLLKQLQVTTQ